jgi:hypothetical protein
MCRVRTENTERAYLAILRPKQKSEAEPQAPISLGPTGVSGRGRSLVREWNTPKGTAKAQPHSQADDGERREARHLQGSPQLHGALDRLHRLRPARPTRLPLAAERGRLGWGGWHRAGMARLGLQPDGETRGRPAGGGAARSARGNVRHDAAARPERRWAARPRGAPYACAAIVLCSGAVLEIGGVQGAGYEGWACC